MEQDAQLQVRPLAELPEVKVHGRTNGSRSPVALFWTGSALECRVDGTELWVELESDYRLYEPWISITVNGAQVSRQMVTAGRHWICVFRGMNRDAVKHVRIVRDVQAMSADPYCVLLAHAIKSDGQLHPALDKPYKLEFIGDSITSGEGVIGARQETDWISMWFSAVHNYTAMTADALDADHRVLSQSGWGVLTSWDNNPNASLPRYYEQVCGLLNGARNEELGAHDAHDFSAWQPDIVVVNLGTNDGGAYNSPAWTDPATGSVHKQRLNEDGTYHPDDLRAFEDAAEQFLDKLRQHNPGAHLVWAYGMLGIPMMPAIYRAVERYKSRTGDRKVSVFQLPNMTDATVGARTHPGIAAHEQAAEALSQYLKSILGAIR